MVNIYIGIYTVCMVYKYMVYLNYVNMDTFVMMYTFVVCK